MDTTKTYDDFVKEKLEVNGYSGIHIYDTEIPPMLYPHQKDAVKWAIKNGQALIGMAFGLGKTLIQLAIAKVLINRYPDSKFLIVCPLGVRHQFTINDAPKLGIKVQYVGYDSDFEYLDTPYLITNYERVRDGKIDPRKHDIIGVSLDEGSILRNLGNKTSDVFVDVFKDVPYKFCATATPAPNEYKEIIYYARWLGIMDHGQSLAQPLDAKILTPTGWTTMGKIKVGDSVIASNGQQTTVSGVFPQGEKDIYKVTFSDKTSTECTLDHLWLTRTQKERANERRYNGRNREPKSYETVKSTEEIMKTLKSRQGALNHTIPLVSPVEFEPQEVGIDPWLMGYLLGDGHFRETSINFTSSETWFAEKVNSLVAEYNLFAIKTKHERKDGAPNYDYRISSGKPSRGTGKKTNHVLNEIRDCGLVKKRAWNKFVPRKYLFNTARVRLSVLQGLMDADGTIAADGTQAKFISSSEKLANDVIFIVQSLGGTATKRKRQGITPSGKKGRMLYYVPIRLPNGINPFSLPRKAQRVREWTNYPPKRFIVSVEKIGTKPAQCIRVEHEKHLYVTDEFIVTHNTRFFKRDPKRAGHLTLHPQHEKAFWLWVASWALFLNKPSDLGYSDVGYDLPRLHIHWHRIKTDHTNAFQFSDNRGQYRLLMDTQSGVSESAREKRATLPQRLAKMHEILSSGADDTHWLIWHHLEDERRAIEKSLPEVKAVYGSLKDEKKEERILGFQEGKIRLLATKPQLSGYGCNFQYHCHHAIFLGIDYKFQDLIQAVHRIYRFQQDQEVHLHFIYAESEDRVARIVQEKWKRYDELTERMREIVQTYGLSHEAIKGGLKRTMDVTRQEVKTPYFRAINNDCVKEIETMPDNSIGLHFTSVPFGDHYEYTTKLQDFGHNNGNAQFWKQMDYLIPHMLRTLKPGRICLIHAKDRVLYGHQTPTGFMEIAPFSDECVIAFRKHGFLYEGRRTIVTDVVQENASTYRLGWTEMSKDASKMGSGLPEYILQFRKPPTDNDTQRGDEPVTHDKAEYTRARWQVDAHSFWQSSGDRLVSIKEPDGMVIIKNAYDYEQHVKRLEALDEKGHLPASYFYEPPKSRSEYVWDDVVFMQCLNSNQALRKRRNHICPLPLDIVKRGIELYSNPGDVVCDVFAGLFTVVYQAVLMDRIGWGIELNSEYWEDGVSYCKLAETKAKAPTLFEFAGIEV